MLFVKKPKETASVRNELCAAIKSRRVVEFDYHGRTRTVEPFCLGMVIAGQADNESLLCYQLGGYSDLGVPVGWKLYRASEITGLKVSDTSFSGSRPGYDPEHLAMARVYCFVTPETVVECAPELAAAPEVETESEKGAPADVTAGPAPARGHNELMQRFRFTHHDPPS